MLKRIRTGLCILAIALCVSGCTMPEKVMDLSDYVPHEAYSSKTTSEEQFKQVRAQDLAMLDTTGYYYSCLTAEEQTVYGELYYIFRDRLTDTEVSVKDPETVKRVAEAVLLDHPEFFALESYNMNLYTRSGQYIHIIPSGVYNCDAEREADLRKQIDAYVERAIQGISETDSDYLKTKKIYEYIILNTDYVLNSPDNQNMISVAINGQSVCNGYSKTFMYIMRRLGIECFMVNGFGNEGMLHAWSIVKLDGEYYHVDVTWGDTTFDTSEEWTAFNDIYEIGYDYLAVPDEWILKNHTIENSFGFEIPKCTSIAKNYYVQEGLLMEKFTAAGVRNLFDRANQDGSDYVLMKFTDKSEYDACYEYLITDTHIWDYVGTFKSGVTYYTSDSALLFIILLK